MSLVLLKGRKFVNRKRKYEKKVKMELDPGQNKLILKNFAWVIVLLLFFINHNITDNIVRKIKIIFQFEIEDNDLVWIAVR